ncbi:MAG: oligosaccharide flippase family protein [Chloroflexota bacterium]
MRSQSRAITSTLKWGWESLRGGSAGLFTALMIANVIGYVYQMLMARMMTPEDYGVLITLTSISYVLTVLMRSFQMWIIEAVGKRRDATNVRMVFLAATRTLVPLGLLAFALHWVFSGEGADFLQMRSSTPLIMLGLYTLSSFLVPIPRGVLMGMKRLSFAGFILVLEPVVRLASAILLVMWGFSVNGAILSFALGNLVAFMVALIPIWFLLNRNRAEEQAEGVEGTSRLRALDRYALTVLAINSCLMLISSIDQVAVKHYFSEQVAGNYAVAFLLGRVIVMITLSLGWVVFTRSATMTPDDPRRIRLLTRSLVIIGVISTVLTTGYILFPSQAVHLMGGAEYSSAKAYVGMVGIEMTLFALVYIQAYFLISLRKTQVIWPLCVAAVLEVILIAEYHDTVTEVLLGLIAVMGGLLVTVSALSWWLIYAKSSAARVAARATARATGDMADIKREGMA